MIEHSMFVLGRATFVDLLTVFFIDLTYRPVMNMEWIKQSVVVCGLETGIYIVWSVTEWASAHVE